MFLDDAYFNKINQESYLFLTFAEYPLINQNKLRWLKIFPGKITLSLYFEFKLKSISKKLNFIINQTLTSATIYQLMKRHKIL